MLGSEDSACDESECSTDVGEPDGELDVCRCMHASLVSDLDGQDGGNSNEVQVVARSGDCGEPDVSLSKDVSFISDLSGMGDPGVSRTVPFVTDLACQDGDSGESNEAHVVV